MRHPSLRSLVDTSHNSGRREGALEKVEPVESHQLVDFGRSETDIGESLSDPAKVEIAAEPGGLRRKHRCGVSLLGPASQAHPLDHAVRLVLTKIRADAKPVHTHQI